MKKRSGFTLIEVIIVIGIVAILTVIIFPSVSNIRAKNRDTERVADISALQLALSLYYNKNGSYPDVNRGLDAVSPTYTPLDSKTGPESADEYIYVPLTRGGASDPCSYYHLGVKLELSNTQIDTSSAFSTVDSDSDDAPDAANGYKYCGVYAGTGIPAYVDGDDDDKLFYSVRP
jgi:prepilin-type N-terminal cleavage/methylation domain-containing protein